MSPAINPAFPNYSNRSILTPEWARVRSAFLPTPAIFRWTGVPDATSLRMTGTLVSRRDDSTFLYDKNYYNDYGLNDNTMLLPNRNLDPSYQRLDLYGSFQISKRVSAYAAMQNLLNQHYYEAFGYPGAALYDSCRNASQTWRGKLETALTTRPRPRSSTF